MVVGNDDTVGCKEEMVGVVVRNAPPPGDTVGTSDDNDEGAAVLFKRSTVVAVGCREEKAGVVVESVPSPGDTVGTSGDNDEGAVVLFKETAVVFGVGVGNVPPPGEGDDAAVVLFESSCKLRNKAEAVDSSIRIWLPPCSCAGGLPP